MDSVKDKTAQEKWNAMTVVERRRAVDQAMREAMTYGQVESVMGGSVEHDSPCSPLLLDGMI